MIDSCIFEGQVVHRRHQPVQHQFKYPLFMMYIDLDEVDRLFDKHWFWSSKGPNLAWFRRADHYGPINEALDVSIRKLIQKRNGVYPDGPIRLLTHFRYFGYVINPISVYYCFDQHESLQFVVAEVTNTPWGERCCYVLDVRNPDQEQHLVKKAMHVSPFMSMDLYHSFRVSDPGDSLFLAIENKSINDERPFFDAEMRLERRPINSQNLTKVLLRYPLMTGQVFARIYWQALRIWWKRVPVFKNPGNIVENQLAKKNWFIARICSNKTVL